jgi:hypothetical protein
MMKIWIRIILGLAAAGIVALFLIYYFYYNKPHPDFEKTEAAYTLPASEIFAAFTTNRADAEAKYNGKVIALSGKLSKTETTDSLVIAVFVFSQGMFGDEGVRCTMLPSAQARAAGLQPGTDVVIKGFCAGFSESDVILEKCSFVQ